MRLIQARDRGFTLLELLVTMVVFGLIMAILLGIVSHTSSLTRRASERITTFQTARAAFDLLTEKISQATLHTYWDYDNPGRPTRYLRSSELHFVVGNAGANGLPGTPGTGQAVFFQAPLGVSATAGIRELPDLLNACGFFIQYGPVDQLPAPFPAQPTRYRYQLMQTVEAAESLSVYLTASGRDWIDGMAAGAIPIAENVVYFSVWPRRSPSEDPEGTSLTGDFSYDSRLGAAEVSQPITAHQMPPLLQVTLIVMDESSAERFCVDSTPPAEIAGAFNNLFTESDSETFLENQTQAEINLAALHLNFRVFSALVPIRESKME